MSSLKDKKSSKTKAVSALNAPPAATGPVEVVIGVIVGIGPDGAPLVDFAGNPADGPVPAMATARYDLGCVGCRVALMFMSGDPSYPLALGVVAHLSAKDTVDGGTARVEPNDPPERLTLAAKRELVLQCGRASIVLTRAGKVLLQGTYVSSRSTGMQRITGASVHIN
jgi:hypothetical protein